MRDAPSEPLDPSKTYALDVRHDLWLVHGHPRSEARAEHCRVARRARQRRLLRQHDLPSRRSRVRDPGRRSDTDGRGRAGVLDRRQAAGRREVHEGHRRDGEVAGSRRPERRAASSSSSRTTRQRTLLTPDYAIVGEVTDGMDTVERIDGARRGGRSAVAAGRHLQRHRHGELMARRRGRPRGRRGVAVRKPQAAAPPSSRARAPARGVGRRDRRGRRRVRRSIPPDDMRIVACPDWRAGPGASLRCGVSRAGPRGRRRPSSSSPTVRALAGWRSSASSGSGGAAAVSSLRRTRARAGIRSCSVAPTGARFPTKASATDPVTARAVRRPRRARRHQSEREQTDRESGRFRGLARQESALADPVAQVPA